MLSTQLSILNKIQKDPNKRFKVLTCCTHEGYQTLLSKVNADFYMITGSNLKGWDFHTRPLPSNHYLYTQPVDKVQPDVQFDLILCQNRLQQYPLLYDISCKFNIPLIVLDHTEPPPGLTKVQWAQIKTWKGDRNVFITEHNRKTWEGTNEDVVIPHGIDTALFSGYTGEIAQGISVVNHFPSRDIFCGWNLWKEITSKVPCTLVGENPGLSKSINTVPELVKTLCSYRFFLNTSQLSPVPLSMLEAMACGVPIVSSQKQEIPKIIEHGVNGYLYDTPEQAIEMCQILIGNLDRAKELGAAGRQTIIDRFGIGQFASNWNHVFKQVYESKR